MGPPRLGVAGVERLAFNRIYSPSSFINIQDHYKQCEFVPPGIETILESSVMINISSICPSNLV